MADNGNKNLADTFPRFSPFVKPQRGGRLFWATISSRRKAVEFVKDGQVTVNGEVKLEPHYRIQPGDVVVCDGKVATVQERMVYVLLNTQNDPWALYGRDEDGYFLDGDLREVV